MERSRSLPRICFWLSAALTLIGVTLRAVCMLCLFDADIGYFAVGLLPTLSNALYFVAAVAIVLCAALTPRNILPAAPKAEGADEAEQAPPPRLILPMELHTPGRAYAALLMGLALGGFTVATLLLPDLFRGVSGKAVLAANILGLLSSAYFFLSAHKDGRYPDWLSLLGFLPVFWAIAAVADTYFDVYVTLNSPIKVSLQVGLLGFMLILLAELRFRVGRALPRYSLAFLALGAYACLVGSIPLLLATAVGAVSLPRYALYAAVLAVVGLYAFYLLLHYTASPAPATADAPVETSADVPHNAE